MTDSNTAERAMHEMMTKTEFALNFYDLQKADPSITPADIPDPKLRAFIERDIARGEALSDSVTIPPRTCARR